jgi:hypothetical protein
MVSDMKGIRGPIRVKRLRDDTRVVGRDVPEVSKEASCFDAAAEETEVVAHHQNRFERLADAQDVLYSQSADLPQPSLAADPGSERRTVDAHDAETPRLKVKRMPPGTTPHIEDPPFRKPQCPLLMGGPVLVEGKVGPRVVHVDVAIISFYHDGYWPFSKMVHEGMSECILPGTDSHGVTPGMQLTHA